jgi:transposase InsO family protein
MSINMAETIQEERLRWVMPIVRKDIKLVDAAKVCPYGQRSLERWVAAWKLGGDEALAPRSTKPRTSPRETAIRIKEEVIGLRKETKLCAQKLHWRLAGQGLKLPTRTIGKIIKEEGLVRKYRVKRMKYKYLRATLQPGELVEIDVKYVPGPIAGRQYYQYTAIDCASRWRYLAVYEDESSWHSIKFLTSVIALFPHRIRTIKTDNGSIFTNYYLGTNKRSDMTVKKIHALDSFCAERGIVHYLIDPGKPAQNGTVERSHRSDQEAFYDRQTFNSFRDLVLKLYRWNEEYNRLEHCGLGGLSPMQYLNNYQLQKPPNVLA